MKLDSFDTPPLLADQVVGMARAKTPGVVADFAAGGGALLAAAARRWPGTTILGNDVDRGRAQALRAANPAWCVTSCDFSSSYLRRRSQLARYEGAVDVVVLNPPFSDRGGHARFGQTVGGSRVRATRAISFVLAAIPWLSPRGEVVAILPAGALSSERDQRAVALLRELGTVETMPLEQDDLFNGCRVRVCLLRFCLGGAPDLSPAGSGAELESSTGFEFFRGQVSASTAGSGTLPLIHTTALRDFSINGPSLRCGAGVVHEKPMLLLPRVGKPRVDKLAIWSRGPVVISDCIVAIAGVGEDDLAVVRDRIRARFDELAGLYGGTCAPYLTLARLREFVGQLEKEERFRSGALLRPA